MNIRNKQDLQRSSQHCVIQGPKKWLNVLREYYKEQIFCLASLYLSTYFYFLELQTITKILEINSLFQFTYSLKRVGVQIKLCP